MIVATHIVDQKTFVLANDSDECYGDIGSCVFKWMRIANAMQVLVRALGQARLRILKAGILFKLNWNKFSEPNKKQTIFWKIESLGIFFHFLLTKKNK